MNNNVVTITLSPCIDKSTTVDKFIPEKKLKCSYPIFEAGGGGINVSRVLKNFGADTRCIYISGGYMGKILNNLVYHENIHGMPVHSNLYTRENFIVFENKTHLQFRFGMPVNPVNDIEWQEVIATLKKVDSQFVVLSGSVWADINTRFFKELNEYVKATKSKFIVDTAGSALKQIIKTGAFLIKPNQNEFSGLFGKKQLGVKEILAKAKKLVDKGRIENILVSLGKEGAVLVNKEQAVHFIPPKLKVKSTVGAGDSMVAGIVYQLMKGKSIEDAVKFGIACGSATSANSGMQLCTFAGAKKLMDQIKVIK